MITRCNESNERSLIDSILTGFDLVMFLFLLPNENEKEALFFFFFFFFLILYKI